MKVIAPAEWGDSGLGIYFSSVMLNPWFCHEAQGRARVDRQMKKRLSALGALEITDKPRSPNVKQNEFVIDGPSPSEHLEKSTIAKIPNLQLPTTVNASKYLENPFLPAVFKSGVHGGVGDFLIETDEQLNTLKKFLEDKGARLMSSIRFQEFIETTSSRFTSYRILATATGTILASELLYSRHDKKAGKQDVNNTNLQGGLLVDQLRSKRGPYCLYARRFTSNVNRGGKAIPLNGEEGFKPTRKQKEILLSHGISKVVLPDELASIASTVAKTLGRQIGLVVGEDFIQEEGTGNFYYLEANNFPSLADDSNGSEIDAYREVMKKVMSELEKLI